MFISKALDNKNKCTNDEIENVKYGEKGYIVPRMFSRTTKQSDNVPFKLSIISKILILIILLSVIYLVNLKYTDYQQEKEQTLLIVSSPEVNDIYFIDFRLLGPDVKEKLRPTEKYRIAKVVDITDDIITLLYGVFYYQRQNAVKNSIKYGHLEYAQYFETKRYDVPHLEVLAMYEKEAIYLAKRPVRNKLYNRVVNPIEPKNSSNFFILGQKENNSGEAFLKDKYNELGAEKALVLFQKSSDLGYPKGQVNLATMYINGNVVDKDLNKALYLLKAASLKSHKPAILKYGIVCNKVPQCDEYSFYQELYNSGVNIKVREVKVKPNDIVNTKK